MTIWPSAGNAESSRPPALSTLTVYMDASGWVMDDQDERTSMWHLPSNAEDLRVILPRLDTVSDYNDRILEALRVLSYVERRSLNEVLGDIVFGPADTVAVRLTPDTPIGQAPLALAYEAISALRSYVIGSSAALDDRSLVLPANRSRRVESFANAARFATLPGSFIMSLTLPLIAEFEVARGSLVDSVNSPREPEQPMLVDIPPQPFGRRVTNRMATVATYAQGLAEEVNSGNQELDAFGRANAEFANATELEALSGLGGPDSSPYQVRFAQSPLATQRLSQTTLRITPGQQRVMAEAAEYLRTKQSRPNVTVEGSVVNLSRNTNYGPGEIVVLGIVDDSGRARRFHLTLTEEDYADALRAHTDGSRVIVRGDLDIRGTWKWIRPLRAFTLVPGLSDDNS